MQDYFLNRGPKEEVSFRLNDGNVERHSLDRMGSLLKMAIGRRLTYANLIGGTK